MLAHTLLFLVYMSTLKQSFYKSSPKKEFWISSIFSELKHVGERPKHRKIPVYMWTRPQSGNTKQLWTSLFCTLHRLVFFEHASVYFHGSFFLLSYVFSSKSLWVHRHHMTWPLQINPADCWAVFVALCLVFLYRQQIIFMMIFFKYFSKQKEIWAAFCTKKQFLQITVECQDNN